MTAFKPTDEQVAIMDAARSGKTIAVTAGAGTGKTSTMRLAADQIQGRGLYVAFNKAIQTEADATFPKHVECRTAHSLAFRAVGYRFKGRLNGPRQSARHVAELLRVTRSLDLGGGMMLSPQSIARLTVDAVARFCRSTSDEPQWWHTEHLEALPRETYKALGEFIQPLARRVWDDLQQEDGRFRFTHDHYLKMWGLSQPHLPYDFIIFDEAQDADQIVAQVVSSQQHAQQLVVGDANQAIYEWRGAQDALTKWPADERLTLSQSFRFGPAIADEANKWLDVLGSDLRITGSGPTSTIETIGGWPDAVLCRTNATAMSVAMSAMDALPRVSLVGGGQQIAKMAEACLDLQAGRPASHPELAMFKTWGEVQDYVDQEKDGSDLAVFVRLIDQHGAGKVISAVDRLWRKEDQADLVVSTAHKAKGREWDAVMVADDFSEPKDQDGEELPVPRQDAMLAYVTVTRAKRTLDRGSLAWIDHRAEIGQAA